MQIDKSLAGNEIRRLDLRRGMQESDSGMIKRDAAQKFQIVESVIESQDRVLNELKVTKNVDPVKLQDGRDDRGLGKKLNIGKLPMQNEYQGVASFSPELSPSSNSHQPTSTTTSGIPRESAHCQSFRTETANIRVPPSLNVMGKSKFPGESAPSIFNVHSQSFPTTQIPAVPDIACQPAIAPNSRPVGLKVQPAPVLDTEKYSSWKREFAFWRELYSFLPDSYLLSVIGAGPSSSLKT